MKRFARPAVVGAALAAIGLAALTASAKTEPKKGPPLRYAHDYAQAIQEAKERNCVLFVSLHAEH